MSTANCQLMVKFAAKSLFFTASFRYFILNGIPASSPGRVWPCSLACGARRWPPRACGRGTGAGRGPLGPGCPSEAACHTAARQYPRAPSPQTSRSGGLGLLASCVRRWKTSCKQKQHQTLKSVKYRKNAETLRYNCNFINKVIWKTSSSCDDWTFPYPKNMTFHSTCTFHYSHLSTSILLSYKFDRKSKICKKTMLFWWFENGK